MLEGCQAFTVFLPTLCPSAPTHQHCSGSTFQNFLNHVRYGESRHGHRGQVSWVVWLIGRKHFFCCFGLAHFSGSRVSSLKTGLKIVSPYVSSPLFEQQICSAAAHSSYSFISAFLSARFVLCHFGDRRFQLVTAGTPINQCACDHFINDGSVEVQNQPVLGRTQRRPLSSIGIFKLAFNSNSICCTVKQPRPRKAALATSVSLNFTAITLYS